MNFLDLQTITNSGKVARKPDGKLRQQYVDALISQRQSKNISAVLGVRRAGKSTILKHMVYQLVADQSVKPGNILFINLEDPRLVELLADTQLISLTEEFVQQADGRSQVFLILDEVQNVQNWESIVRTIIDREPKVKIYITGSSAQLLGRELGTKLAGRYIKTEVFPLSLAEFNTFSKGGVVKYVNEGGFPDPVLTANSAIRAQLLRDYYESILLRDISARYKIRDDFKLRNLTGWLFSNISNQASSYRLSQDLGLSPETILQFFEYIEDAYLGFFVPKFAQSVRRQIYNPKKFYSIDNGLQSAVAFRVIDDLGKLFENSVFLALRRRFEQIFYWEEEKEVDFIVKEKEQIRFVINAAVTITNEKTKQREVEALVAAMHSLGSTVSYLVVLDGTEGKITTEVGEIEVVRFKNLEKMLNTLEI